MPPSNFLSALKRSSPNRPPYTVCCSRLPSNSTADLAFQPLESTDVGSSGLQEGWESSSWPFSSVPVGLSSILTVSIQKAQSVLHFKGQNTTTWHLKHKNFCSFFPNNNRYTAASSAQYNHWPSESRGSELPHWRAEQQGEWDAGEVIPPWQITMKHYHHSKKGQHELTSGSKSTSCSAPTSSRFPFSSSAVQISCCSQCNINYSSFLGNSFVTSKILMGIFIFYQIW